MSSDVSSVTSHFATAHEGFSTTTSGQVLAAAPTVGLNSVAGLVDGSVFVGVIEPGATKEQVFTGIVDTGGAQITGVVWTKGTNVAHSTGVSIVDYDTGTGFNMMRKGILVSLDQDGTLKAGAVDSATVLASNVVTNPKILAAAVTSPKVDWSTTGGIWWEELGRTTLAVAGDTISLTSFTARKYLKIIIDVRDTGGTINPLVRFNSDSGANYSINYNDNGGANANAVSQTQIALDTGAAAAYPFHCIVEVENILATEKMCWLQSVGRGTVGGGNVTTMRTGSAKWANTLAQINRVDIINTGTGDYAIGSEVIVLGHD
jgi:hypothetical protein